MIIDEYKKAEDTIRIIENKISQNNSVIVEKENEIADALNSYCNAESGEKIDYADKMHIIERINYARSIEKIANRQLNRYLLMKDKPYFGRVDFINEWGHIAYYFGIETLMENTEVIVNDWRSPIANLYYESVCGKASYDSPSGKIVGEVKLKRQYKFENGKLQYFIDNNLNIDDEFLLDVLGKNDDGVMKNIVSTIQNEQNKAIRYISDNNLLVLGVAGSGKTSIALHRIAFLVYKDSIKYDSNKICFITPNEIFFSYIDNVLPELGEDNTIHFSLNEIVRNILKTDLLKNKLRVESKTDYLEKMINGKVFIDFDDRFKNLEYFLNQKMKNLFNDKLGLKISGLTFRSDFLKQLYFEKFKRRNYYERKKMIIEFLLDRVSNVKKVTKAVSEVIETFVNKLLPNVNYFEVYQEFLNEYCNNEPLIHNKTIKYEHIYALCYTKIFFKKTKVFEKYNHLLVDEYQDLNIIERRVIDKVFICNKTFVGDINQKLFLQDYEILKKENSVVELNNAYRSTTEIFSFLHRIIQTPGINGVKRHGNEVVIREFDCSEKLLSFIRDKIKEYEGKSMAIICKSQKSAGKLYDLLKKTENVFLLDIKGKDIKRGIVICGVSLVKGLEFDSVIVYDASEENYSSELDKNYFYIACSRAINELTITGINSLTKYAFGDSNAKI